MNDDAAYTEGRRPKVSKGGNRAVGNVGRFRWRYGDFSTAITLPLISMTPR
jgi:hypothetical protein